MPWSLQITYGHPFVLKRRSNVLKSRKLKPHMIYGYSSTFLHHNFYMIAMSTEYLSHYGIERISHKNVHILVTRYKTITDLAVFQLTISTFCKSQEFKEILCQFRTNSIVKQAGTNYFIPTHSRITNFLFSVAHRIQYCILFIDTLFKQYVKYSFISCIIIQSTLIDHVSVHEVYFLIILHMYKYLLSKIVVNLFLKIPLFLYFLIVFNM